MVQMQSRKRKNRTDVEKVARTSVSLPVEHYQELERIAESNKVSVAWVVRQAVETYLVDRYPLLFDKDKR